MTTEQEINRAARAVAARVVQQVPPLKVPLSEAANFVRRKRTLEKRARVYGVPEIAHKILQDYPEGLDNVSITAKLQMNPKLAAIWTAAHTSHLMTRMGKEGWVVKWPGNIWKVGPKPVKYRIQGHHDNDVRGEDAARVIKVAPRKPPAKAGFNGSGSPEVAVFDRVRSAVQRLRDSLSDLDLVLADLDTETLKAEQRQKAIETARKLLADLGV